MEIKGLSVTGLQTTPAYFCNLMLTHCMGGEDARIVIKRTKDGVRWEQEGTWINSAVHEVQNGKLVMRRLEPVWMDAYDAFWCSAFPVALSRDLVRVDFIFSEDAEGFLRDIVLRELRLSWPEMQITEDEQETSDTDTEQAAAQVVSRGQAHAKGKVSDEMKARANCARSLHAEHPEWSTQNVADHLMDTLTDDELRKLKRGFNRQSCPLMGEDIENAWHRMAKVEGSEKWPMWSTGKNPLR